MTHWYPYRWVCDSCRSTHYYAVTACCNCSGSRITRFVHNKKMVAVAKQRKKAAKQEKQEKQEKPAAIPDEAAEAIQGTQILKNSPIEQVDDALSGKSGEMTVRQSESPGDFDDMINNILEG